jgi:hypothetical protein
LESKRQWQRREREGKEEAEERREREGVRDEEGGGSTSQ